MRVEVLDAEEIEEKQLMTPGDIVMMLNEMGKACAAGTRDFSPTLPLFGFDVPPPALQCHRNLHLRALA
jgi:hypothetical protein